MKASLLFVLAALTLAACDQKGSTDSTKERAGAEQEAARDVENRNLASKAELMEKELARRHDFYASLQGQFEGIVKVGDESYGIKIMLTKSLAPYTSDRVRQLSEIESDIANLFFHAQVVQWHPDDPATAVGCRVSQIRPDMQKGTLTISASECPNLYRIYISEGGSRAFQDKERIAEALAIKIRSNELEQVTNLVGLIQPSMNANTYTFAVKRTN